MEFFVVVAAFITEVLSLFLTVTPSVGVRVLLFLRARGKPVAIACTKC